MSIWKSIFGEEEMKNNKLDCEHKRFYSKKYTRNKFGKMLILKCSVVITNIICVQRLGRGTRQVGIQVPTALAAVAGSMEGTQSGTECGRYGRKSSEPR